MIVREVLQLQEWSHQKTQPKPKTIKSLDWQWQLIRRRSQSPGSPGRKWGKGKKFERFGNVWKVIFIRDFNNKI